MLQNIKYIVENWIKITMKSTKSWDEYCTRWKELKHDWFRKTRLKPKPGLSLTILLDYFTGLRWYSHLSKCNT